MLHTVWNGLQRRANGWLACLDFDAGDLAFGAEQRFRSVLGDSLQYSNRAESLSHMTKVAALVRDGDRILIVRKEVSGRTEFITPGGKPMDGECQEETLRRELAEELSVKVCEIEWFGWFDDQATFENIPITMDVYEVKIQGTPTPSTEIVELAWIDPNCQGETPLGNLLKRGILPALKR